jgi:HK97 family phage major capsid protein
MNQIVAGGAIELKGADDVDVVTQALANLESKVDARIGAVETKAADAAALADRLDKIETRLSRPNVNTKADDVSVERKSFGTYLRFGNQAPAEELKGLNVSTDTQGGYLAPAEMSTEFIRDLVEFSPIRAVASVRTTGAPSVIYPKRTSGTNATWKGETQAADESTATFGQAEIAVHELKTYVDISDQLLQDAGAQVEAEVRMALAEDFGKKEAAAFVNGTGSGQPAGLMTNADIASIANGHATNLDPDALIKLLYALPATYRNAGSWAMNGTTLAAIRKLKDGQGNYLWQPAYVAGQPETILGRPVVEMLDMPDVAADAFPIIYGDFSAYRIVDRIGLSIKVDPYSLATNSMTRFHANRRVGGAVLQAARFRKLKMATA